MMRFRKSPDTWLILFFAVISASMLWSSFSLSGIAGLVPRVIASTVLVLLMIQLILLRNQRQETPESTPLRADRFLRSSLWLVLMPLCTWVLGLVFGPALFCAIFLRWHGRESWLVCAGYAALLAVMVSVTLILVLRTTPYPGLLGSLWY